MLIDGKGPFRIFQRDILAQVSQSKQLRARLKVAETIMNKVLGN